MALTMEKFVDSVVVAAPVAEVWNYYVEPANLAELTLPSLGMRVIKADMPLGEGSRVRFGLRPRGFPLEIRWDARISNFQPLRTFTDSQVRGPFERWVHRHDFETTEDGRTRIVDSLEIGAPLGIFGRVAENLLVGQKIEALFEHRRRVLHRRFGAQSPGAGTLS